MLLGFGLAVLVSVPLGIVMGTFLAGQAAFEPMIGLLRYLPASAFVPLLIIWLGIDEASKIAILFIGTVFFNTLMVADVVRRVPGALIDVSYTMGARRGEVLRKVIVPHALPGILDAIRVNAAAAWNLVVVAELIASTVGLGHSPSRRRATRTPSDGTTASADCSTSTTRSHDVCCVSGTHSNLPSGYPEVNRAWMWGALLAATIVGWLHQLTAIDEDGQLIGHGLRGGQAMIATLRHRLIAVPARLVRHAGALTLRLPPGEELLEEILARIRALPAPS